MRYWHDGGGWGWGWVWMIVVMAVVWVPLLIAFLWFMRSLAGGRSGDRDRPADAGGVPRSESDLDAREIARRAYARGDLDRERFLQIMEDLGGGGPKPES